MIKQISDIVWQFYFSNFGSNCYLVKTPAQNVLIDTSSMENRNDLIENLSELSIKANDISTILLTHMHYDHIGNLLVFKNVEAYASEKEISDFYKNPATTIWDEISNKEIESIKAILKPISEFKNKFFEVIASPGHTHGSLAFYMPKEKILFSGDTIFEVGVGRIDLPTSKPEEISKSIRKLRNMDYKILCAGH